MHEHILITGGAGFIGSRLAHRFATAGHTVSVLDSFVEQVHGPDPRAALGRMPELTAAAAVTVGSVTSFDDLRAALEGATIVVHLAAETGTGQSMYEIDRYVATNIGGTAKLLDVLAKESHSVRRVVVASSRSIYGEGAYRTPSGEIVFPPERDPEAMARGEFEVQMPGVGALEMVPTPEGARLHPSSVYGITKQTQESLVMTAGPALGIEPVSLRYQNVYGPGQSVKNPYTGILSIFSTLIRQNKPINVFEDGRESRDFVYVDDVVEATFLGALEAAAAGHVLNVGSGVATTVSDLVATLFAAFGEEVPVTVSGSFRVGDIRHNVADTRLLGSVLGFTPAVPFEEGVRRFVEWARTEPLEAGGYERSLAELAERKLLK